MEVEKRIESREELLSKLFKESSEKFENDAYISLSSEYGMEQRISNFFMEFEKIPKRKLRILDVGCGSGIYVKKLSELNHDVTGTDLLKQMVKFASKKSKGNSSNFMIANAYTLPFKDHTFDVVISIGLFECLDDYINTIKEMQRVLKTDDGTLYIITLNSLCVREIFRQIVRFFSKKDDFLVSYDPYKLKYELKKMGFMNVKFKKIIHLPLKFRKLYKFNIIYTFFYKSPTTIFISNEIFMIAKLTR